MEEFLWRIRSDKDTETFNAWVNELLIYVRINTTSVVYVNNNQILLEDITVLLVL